MHLSTLFLLVAISTTSGALLPRTPVSLGVSPKCGTFSGSPADVNAGLGALSSYKIIVSFGDSYTDGGVHDGSPLLPPVLTPPNPKAGGRTSNGPVWVEYLAKAANATLRDFAVAGAVVANGQWPSTSSNSVPDFAIQFNTLFNIPYPIPDPATTLYTIFFGIEDYVLATESGSTDLSNVAGWIVYTILELISSPVFAKNILVIDNYGRGTSSPMGEAFKQDVFSGLSAIHSKYGTNVGFVDLANIWNGVLGSTPGYAAFGYTSPGACLASANTTIGQCADPDHTFYWAPGTPSTATHQIISDYVQEVLTQCKT